jgi:hypothetical protein
VRWHLVALAARGSVAAGGASGGMACGVRTATKAAAWSAVRLRCDADRAHRRLCCYAAASLRPSRRRPPSERVQRRGCTTKAALCASHTPFCDAIPHAARLTREALAVCTTASEEGTARRAKMGTISC